MSDKRRNSLYRQIGFISTEANMDREDRLEFARHALTNKDYGYIKSLTEVDTDDLEDLLLMLKGWRLTQRIRLHNRSLFKEAEILVAKMQESAEESAERQTETGAWD